MDPAARTLALVADALNRAGHPEIAAVTVLDTPTVRVTTQPQPVPAGYRAGMRRELPALLAAVTALAGCGQTQPDPPAAPAAPTVQATSPAPPPDGGRYTTGNDLAAALNTAGVACAGYEDIPGAVGALTRGSCDHAGRELILSIYADRADAEAHVQFKAELLAGASDVHIVVGGNWTVSCDTADDCTAVDTAIGGETHNIPK